MTMADKKSNSPHTASPPPGVHSPQASSDIIRNMKNTIKISFADAEENTIKVFDSLVQQLAGAAQQMNKMQNNINTFETFFKENNLPLDLLIPKQKGTASKTPNRQTRRKIQQLTKKSDNKQKN